MAEAIEFAIEADPREEDCQIVRDGLNNYNGPFAGPDNLRPLAIFARDDSGAIRGGLLGETFWRWLHISILWVNESDRHQQIGTRLLAMAEKEAVDRGCMGAFVDSLSFQAPDFYRKNGYLAWGEIANLPPDHSRIFFQKPLKHD